MQLTSRRGRLLLLCTLIASQASVACTSSSSQRKPDAPVGQDAAAQPASPEALATLEAARAAANEGRTQDALGLYKGFVTQNPNTLQTPDALLEAGNLALKLDDRAAARMFFEQLALNHPTHTAARSAKVALARLDIKEGRAREGLSGLRTCNDQSQDPAECLKAAKEMGLAMVETGEHAGAVASLATAEAATADAAEREQLRGIILKLIDEKLAAREVLELREGLPPNGYAHRVLTLKLARIYLHMGDEPRAKEQFEAFLAVESTGALADHARSALAVIQQRNLVATKKLGVVLPITGKHAPIGERVLAALKLGLESAVSEAIAKGQTTPPPTPVEIVVVDDKGEAEDAGAAVDGLIQEHKVMAVTGALTLNGARGAALRAEALRVPLLTLARKEGLPEMGPYTYQLALTDERQAREVARIAAQELGFKRAALLYPRLPKGVSLINAFWDEFERHGGQIAGAESYDHDETTFTTPVRKLVGRHYLEARGEYMNCQYQAKQLDNAYKKQKALEACKDGVVPMVDFDALFIADYHGPVGLIAPALAFEDVFVGNDERALRAFKQTTGRHNVRMVQLLGTNGFNDKSLPQRGGKYVQGALFVDGFDPNDGRPETEAFLKAFQTATGKTADLREAQAYDAGRVLGFIFATNPQTRAEFTERLAKVQNFPGVCGPTSFDPQGTAVTPLHVFTIRNNSIVPATLEKKAGG